MNNLKSTILACAILSGCSSTLSSRMQSAEEMGMTAGFKKEMIVAQPFSLTAWSKIDSNSTTLRIYIEGDGLAWLSKTQPSRNPTPSDPLALRLAIIDPAPNVIYLARPCQYSGMADGSTCPQKYWTRARTAPEVILAYQDTLDGLKKRYGLDKFELVGYSGGGGVAVLLAAGRTDVASIRTVAGNIDYSVFSAVHRVSPLAESLSPEAVAEAIATIPQVHFVGAEDTTVPIAIAESWVKNSGFSGCVQTETVTEADHYNGWTQQWPLLVAYDPVCVVSTFPSPLAGEGETIH